MKVAQILSTIPEALPREYAEELMLAGRCPADGMVVCQTPDDSRAGRWLAGEICNLTDRPVQQPRWGRFWGRG